MTASSSFDYMQARLQARHGQRPGDDRWRLLESTTDLGTYLQHARATALAPWVQHLPPQASVHEIEQSIRRNWRAYSAQVAGWAPVEWRAALLWTGHLPDLPFISHLARGGSVRPWMLEDTALAPLAMEDFQRRREALSASPLAGVADQVSRGQSPVEAWLDAWQSTWPVESQGRDFASLRGLITTYLESVHAEPIAHRSGPGLREPLTGRLTALFRRESGKIGAAFAHLGLMLLDLERLRGGMVLRALFPNPQERPQWA